MLKAESLAKHVNVDGKSVLDFVNALNPDEQMSWRDSQNRPSLAGVTYQLTQVRFNDQSVAIIAKGSDESESVFLSEADWVFWMMDQESAENQKSI